MMNKLLKGLYFSVCGGILLFLSRLSCVSGYTPYVPPPLPLSPFPVVNGEQLREYAQEVVSVLGEATLPTRPDEVIAIILSETIAGFTGGISERVAAYLVGDEKSLGAVITGTTTGAYFGVRSAAFSLASAVGLPTPAARVFAGIVASFAAEVLKIAERKYEEDREKEELITVENGTLLPKTPLTVNIPSKLPTFNGPDVIQDVTKWVAYGLLLPETYTDAVPIPVAAQFGGASALIAHFIYECLIYNQQQQQQQQQADAANNSYDSTKSNNNNGSTSPIIAGEKPWIARYVQAMVEGAVLFAVYEGSINFFAVAATPELRKFLQWKFASFSLLSTTTDIAPLF